MANIQVYQSDQMISIKPAGKETRVLPPSYFGFDRSADGNRFIIRDLYREQSWESNYDEVHDSTDTDAGGDGDAVEAYLTGLTASIGGGQQSAYDEYFFFVQTDGANPATYSIATTGGYSPLIPSGYSLSVAIADRGDGNRIEVNLGRVNGRSVGSSSTVGDAYMQFITTGNTINIHADPSDSNIDHYYLTIVPGQNFNSRIDGWFTSDGAGGWSWTNFNGQITPTIDGGLTDEDRIVFTTPAGEPLISQAMVLGYSNLSNAKILTQSTAGGVTTVDIRLRKEADGTAATTSEVLNGDKVYVQADAVGIGREFIDPDYIPGAISGSGWSCQVRLVK